MKFLSFCLRRACKIGFVGFYLYLGGIFLLDSVGLMALGDGVSRSITSGLSALVAVILLGSGALFFEDSE